jgi:ABC-type multidrug transport system ATPase subunit
MVALMGASGSGKTTFLSCLRQDISHTGEIRFDGAHYSKSMRQLIGYAEQDDVVLPMLTVSESLLFLAEMRYGIGSKEAIDKTNAVLALMRLEKVAHTQVGEPGTTPRISGGERKRMCIGRELLSEPKLLLCDEPTSGLDSTMAIQVMSAMRGLCDSGKVSLVSSIHQPSTAILESFDDVLLLREGRVIYYGPVQAVESLFASCGPQRSVSQSTAEYLIDCLVLPEGDPKGMSEEAISKLAGLVVKQQAVTWSSPAAKLDTKERINAPFCRQLSLLLRLHYKLAFSTFFTKMNTIQNICLMLIPAALWANLSFTDLDVNPRFGLVLWTLGTWMFFPLFGNMMAFQTHRRMLEKELKTGCYSLEAFFLTRTILVLPLGFVWPLLWTAGVYWISNVNPSVVQYMQFQLLVFLIYAIYEGFGQMISSFEMGMAHANTLALVLITFWFAWSGFFVQMFRLSVWLRWLEHCNIFMYAVQLGLQIVLSSDLTFTCDGFGTEFTSKTCGSKEDTFSGLDARSLIGIDRSPVLCLVILVGTLLSSRLVTYVFLRYNLRHILHGVKESIAPTQVKEKRESKEICADRPQDCTDVSLSVQEEELAV